MAYYEINIVEAESVIAEFGDVWEVFCLLFAAVNKSIRAKRSIKAKGAHCVLRTAALGFSFLLLQSGRACSILARCVPQKVTLVGKPYQRGGRASENDKRASPHWFHLSQTQIRPREGNLSA